MATSPGIVKKILWPLFFLAIFLAFLVVPAYRALPPEKSIYVLLIIPAFLWFASLLFQNDRMCSRITENIFLLASVLCFAVGIILQRYHVFPEKPGFFVVAFGTPLLFVGIAELFRITYVRVRHEPPCINVRSGRWIGDRPLDGFFTTFPREKVISWADVLFGLAQWLIPLVIVFVLFVCSLALDW